MTKTEFDATIEEIVKQFYDEMIDDIKKNNAAEALFVLSVVVLSLTAPTIVENKNEEFKNYCDYLLDRIDNFASAVMPSDNSKIHAKAIQYLNMLMMDIRASAGSPLVNNQTSKVYN